MHNKYFFLFFLEHRNRGDWVGNLGILNCLFQLHSTPLVYILLYIVRNDKLL